VLGKADYFLEGKIWLEKFNRNTDIYVSADSAANTIVLGSPNTAITIVAQTFSYFSIYKIVLTNFRAKTIFSIFVLDKAILILNGVTRL